MRIRSIKPEFFRDPKVAKVSLSARLLMIGLLTEADDEGRLLGSSKLLAGSLFPHDDAVSPGRVTRWTDELEGNRLVQRYEVESIEYLFIITFKRHQRISHPTPSKLPPPPEFLRSGSGTSRPKSAREQGTGSKEQGTGNAAAPRPRDLTFEAFCEVTGVDWHDLSDQRRREVNGMLAGLVRLGANPEEIRRRAANWDWGFQPNPENFTKRWAELASPRSRNGRETPTDELLREVSRRERDDRSEARGDPRSELPR